MKIELKVILVSFIFVLGCSSSQKQSDHRTENDDLVIPPPLAKESGGFDSDNGKPEVKPETKRAVVVSSSALEKAQQTLQESIRSQNDEAIYRASIQVLSLSPSDVRAQNSLGLYHYKKGRILAAQYFFNKALAQNPNSSELHNNLGLVQLAQKENRTAIKSFRKAFELDHGNIAAASNLGAIYVEQKDFNKAAAALEIAAKSNSRDFKTYLNYGIALAGTGKAALARDQYQQALKLNSTSREALYNLAVVEVEQLKQFQDGLDHLNKVKFLGVPDSARMRINALENKAKAGLK